MAADMPVSAPLGLGCPNQGEAIRAAVEEAEFMRTEALQEVRSPLTAMTNHSSRPFLLSTVEFQVQVPGDEDALQAPHENVLMSLSRLWA